MNHLEASKNAEAAVVKAASAHRVDVRTLHHRRPRLAAWTHADHVADTVDRNGKAELAHPADDEIAPLLVLIAQREAAHTAPLERTDLPQRLQSRE